ncbi:conserved hypothetical protein [Histoplasma mississippiense (nom. inval.)]|uniref:conserved hypothetical protein n=1 Tax=Ajellomyces capsulatus (strain NAm1 / WU24) TaxID=2059318 RepID=UPI000157CA45|nr:conserved hypothetical protein [Histoplasma mississippiense (nom. inval.)]EDN09503.1 conserved hypothetical protein [Histoplasma mississippiense (nom. inval.)]
MDASEPRLAEERLGFNGRITQGAGKLDYHDDGDDGECENDTAPKPRQLPDDLPTSLDDRRSVPTFGPETEIYDAWQGQSHFLTNPIPAKPLSFNLALDDGSHDEEYGVHSRYTHNYYLDDGDSTTRAEAKDSDARLMEMLAAQAAHREVESVGVDEDDIATDDKMSYEDKRDVLQRSLNMAASNGDVERVRKLVGGKARQYVDVNTPDEEGTVPLIYASCFGHQEVVSALLEAGANVDKQDRNRWSALMWAMTNRHKTIAKVLLDYGASPDIKSSSGGTAFDFAQPGTDISKYLQENGYHFGASVAAGDYYDFGFSHNRFEEEMAENEMKRRMMMEESAINLEVDLSSLGLDEKLELPDDFEDQQEFRHLAELIHEIFILIIRDAERRMDKVLDTAMLDHETIPGFEDVHFQNEWNLFRSRTKILAQLLYWLGVELFNRIMTTRRYLARTKAMQIRMNVSALEDWARNNNRQPEHYENGSTLCSGETTVDSARKYLAPVIQLLQWLQCFSSLGDDTDSLTMTLQQLQQLTPSQLLHAVRHYRPEVGEKGLPKAAMKYLLEVRKEPSLLAQIHHPQSPITQPEEKVLPRLPPAADSKSTLQTTTNTHPSDDKPPRTISADGGSAAEPPTQYPTKNHQSTNAITQSPPSSSPPGPPSVYSLKPDPGTILLNPTSTLPFSLPTNTDMLVSYGAGFGGVNRERARKYIPTVPTEFLNKFDREIGKKIDDLALQGLYSWDFCALRARFKAHLNCAQTKLPMAIVKLHVYIQRRIFTIENMAVDVLFRKNYVEQRYSYCQGIYESLLLLLVIRAIHTGNIPLLHECIERATGFYFISPQTSSYVQLHFRYPIITTATYESVPLD